MEIKESKFDTTLFSSQYQFPELVAVLHSIEQHQYFECPSDDEHGSGYVK